MVKKTVVTTFVLLALSLAGTASRAYATPITYSINFVNLSGSPAPTSGSFIYDSAAALTSRFSAFTVVWAGFTFDFTTAANTPTLVATGVGCTSGATSATVFAIFSNIGQCPGSPNAFTYLASADLAGASFSFFDAGNPSTNNLALKAGAAPNGFISGQPPISGNYSISTAPEPSTFLLAFAGGVLYFWRRRFLQV